MLSILSNFKEFYIKNRTGFLEFEHDFSKNGDYLGKHLGEFYFQYTRANEGKYTKVCHWLNFKLG